MVVALAINLLLVVAAVVGAVLFHSVALVADAGHVLSDVGAIGLALFAAAVASRPAGGRRTFGYHRTEILAALANGVALVVVAVFVVIEAIMRLSHPAHVHGLGVLVIGAVGLIGNAVATVALAGGDREDINLEAILRHSAADALGSLAVLVSGAVVLATGWDRVDPITGLLLGVLILAGSWRLISEPIDVLMEAAPPGVDVEEVGQAMVAVEGVREVHDLHVWTVTSGFPALAAHVRTDATHDPDEVRHALEHELAERFGIEHTTLQTMVEQLLDIEDRRPGRD
ncbi:MAG TPA: cation diffusion facilitator family transporter [Thermoleophilaceae bacterium]